VEITNISKIILQIYSQCNLYEAGTKNFFFEFHIDKVKYIDFPSTYMKQELRKTFEFHIYCPVNGVKSFFYLLIYNLNWCP